MYRGIEEPKEDNALSYAMALQISSYEMQIRQELLGKCHPVAFLDTLSPFLWF